MALQLGRTVGELLDTCSYPELLEWVDYYIEEPFGEWRGDVRSGVVASVIANCNRDPKRKAEPYMFSDFMVFDKRGEKVMIEAEAAEVDEEGAHIDPATIGWLFGQAFPGTKPS